MSSQHYKKGEQMKTQIIPSIISKTQKDLDKRLNKVKKHVKKVQLDVMDGKFAKNTSFEFNFKLPKGLHYEAQLMIKDPQTWIEKHGHKVNTIIFHLESTKNTKQVIKQIRQKKKKVGIAIKPSTKIEKLKPYIKLIDMVLIMTVNIGFYGGKFLPSQLKKVAQLRNSHPQLNIEVDGGISNKTIKAAKDAGANMFVSGSYIQKSKDVGKAIKSLRSK